MKRQSFQPIRRVLHLNIQSEVYIPRRIRGWKHCDREIPGNFENGIHAGRHSLQERQRFLGLKRRPWTAPWGVQVDPGTSVCDESHQGVVRGLEGKFDRIQDAKMPGIPHRQVEAFRVRIGSQNPFSIEREADGVCAGTAEGVNNQFAVTEQFGMQVGKGPRGRGKSTL